MLRPIRESSTWRHRGMAARLAAQHSIPVAFASREATEAGGLMITGRSAGFTSLRMLVEFLAAFDDEACASSHHWSLTHRVLAVTPLRDGQSVERPQMVVFVVPKHAGSHRQTALSAVWKRRSTPGPMTSRMRSNGSLSTSSSSRPLK
jgi:hypothetical protein